MQGHKGDIFFRSVQSLKLFMEMPTFGFEKDTRGGFIGAGKLAHQTYHFPVGSRQTPYLLDPEASVEPDHVGGYSS